MFTETLFIIISENLYLFHCHFINNGNWWRMIKTNAKSASATEKLIIQIEYSGKFMSLQYFRWIFIVNRTYNQFSGHKLQHGGTQKKISDSNNHFFIDFLHNRSKIVFFRSFFSRLWIMKFDIKIGNENLFIFIFIPGEFRNVEMLKCIHRRTISSISVHCYYITIGSVLEEKYFFLFTSLNSWKQ